MKRPATPSLASVRVVSHGSVTTLLVEIVLTAIVAATVVFFVGIVVKRPTDGASFFFRAAFGEYVESPAAAAGDGVIVLPAMPVVRDPGATGSFASTARLETVEVAIVPDVAAFARDVLGANAGVGTSPDEALVDVDTALRLGLSVGDTVVLDGLVVGAERVATARVAGLIAPFVEPAYLSTGLVVFPAARADADFVAAVTPFFVGDAVPRTRQYRSNVTGDPEAVDRTGAAWSFVAQMIGADMLAALGGIAIFSGVLWVAVASRLIGRAIRKATPAAAILVALGESPVRARRAAIAMPLLALLAGQVLGVVIVGSIVFPVVMRLTLQPPAIVFILMVLTTLSVLMIALATRVVGEALEPEHLVRSLSGENET
jgi:hypothetical protein